MPSFFYLYVPMAPNWLLLILSPVLQFKLHSYLTMKLTSKHTKILKLAAMQENLLRLDKISYHYNTTEDKLNNTVNELQKTVKKRLTKIRYF